MSGEVFKIILPTAILGITTVITCITNFCKSKKKEKVIKLAQILQKLPEIITSIEECCTEPKTGHIKKLMALNQCQIECNSMGIEYKEDEWSAEIEKILSTPQKK